MKYKLLRHDNTEGVEYTLTEYDWNDFATDVGREVLLFEADTYDEACAIRNRFMNWGQYQPFGIWYAEVGHRILIAGKVQSKLNYEKRQLVVVADTREEAEKKIIEEAERYSKPYKNQYGQDVNWRFDRILLLEVADCFKISKLYKGDPVEIFSKRVTKKRDRFVQKTDGLSNE